MTSMVYLKDCATENFVQLVISIFYLQNLALSHQGRSICLHVRLGSLPFIKKNRQATHTWKFVTLSNIFLRMPLKSKKREEKNRFEPSYSTFLEPSTKLFFAWMKEKKSSSTLVDKIFR